MLIFISHEKGSATGASVYVEMLYKKCLVKKEIRHFHIGKRKFFWMFYNVIKLCFLAVTHKNWVFHLNSATNLYLAVVAKFLGLRLVLHIHETPEFLGSNIIKSILLHYVEEALVFVDQKLMENYPKGMFIQNYIDVENMNFVRKHGKNEVVFSVIGSIDPNKSQLTAIQFLSRQKLRENVILKIIGPCTDPSYLAKVTAASQDVNYTTIISGVIKRELIHAEYDILLACSNNESYGLAVAESLLLKKPVIFLKPDVYPKEFLECDNAFLVDEYLDSEQIQMMLHQSSTGGQQKVLQSAGLENLNKYYEKHFNIADCFQ